MPTINMLRGLLVAGAAVAGIIAAALGQWTAAAILALGIAFHAVLWIQLHRNRAPGREPTPDDSSAGAA